MEHIKLSKSRQIKRKGLKSKTCSVCGKIVYEAIPKTNFSPTDSSETNPDQNPQTSQKTTRKIKLNRRKLTLKKGKSFRLKVTLTPADSQDKITYKTSNKKIATVSKTGKIKAKKKRKSKDYGDFRQEESSLHCKSEIGVKEMEMLMKNRKLYQMLAVTAGVLCFFLAVVLPPHRKRA